MRVLIADDQRVVREGLATIVGSIAGLEVVGLSSDGNEAIAMASELAPDVVLMDLRMPQMDGVTATATIRERHPNVRVVVLTTYADEESIMAALSAGATGYLTKDATKDDIRRALEAAAAGQSVLDPAVHAAARGGQVAASCGPPASCGPAGRAPSGRSHRAGGRGAGPHRGGVVQHGDSGPPLRSRGDGQDARQPHLRQDPQPRPGTGGRLCPPSRAERVDEEVGPRHRTYVRYSFRSDRAE